MISDVQKAASGRLSCPRTPPWPHCGRRSWERWKWAALGGCLWCLIGLGWFSVSAQDNFPHSVPGAAERTARLFQEARAVWRREPTNATVSWQFGRACFDWAEFATNDTQRANVAEEGIAACRAIIRDQPRSAEAHYYLAMNLGQLARTKLLGALRLVSEMEQEFKTVRNLNPALDFAGPDRCLGLLYLDAPGWPASIGSQTKARTHLLRAAELAPRYPENRLCLLEAALRWNDRKLSAREVKEVAALLPEARQRLTGEAWEVSWVDWEARWKKAREKAPSTKGAPPAL